MYRHQRQQCAKIPANGHHSKGRSAATARTATEIAQYEAAVENDAIPGMSQCSDSRTCASRDGPTTVTTTPTDPSLPGERRTARSDPTGRYMASRSPLSVHIHDKLNREEGIPQKIDEEGPHQAQRANARNSTLTLQHASSAICTKSGLGAKSALCADVGNLKSFLCEEDLAGARLGASTEEAAAARRRKQDVPALLRKDHQEFGSSIDSTGIMTITTRSKLNAGGKGDALVGKGISGRGGPQGERLGGQKKDEQRAPKTPTRIKGKRGAVSTPKGATKPDQNKPRAGGTTPVGRKATAPSSQGAKAAVTGTSPYVVAALQRKSTTLAGTLATEAAAAGLTAQEFEASQLQAMKAAEEAKAAEEWELQGSEEAVAKLAAKVSDGKSAEAEKDDGSLISGGSFDALVGDEDDDDNGELGGEEEAKAKETPAIESTQKEETSTHPTEPTANGGSKQEGAAKQQEVAKAEVAKETDAAEAIPVAEPVDMDIDDGDANTDKTTESNLCPDGATQDEKDDEEGAEEEDGGDAGEDDDDEDANDAGDDGEDGADDDAGADDESMEYSLVDTDHIAKRQHHLKTVKELTNRSRQIISEALKEATDKTPLGGGFSLQIAGKDLMTVVEYMKEQGLLCPKWIFQMLTEGFPDMKHFYSFIRLITDLVEDIRREKDNHESLSRQPSSDDDSSAAAADITRRLDRAESALAMVMSKREEVAEDLKETRDQSVFLLCPGKDRICGYVSPDGSWICAKNPRKENSCCPLHSLPKCDVDESKVYCVHQTSLHLDPDPVCSLEDLAKHEIEYGDIDGHFFQPSGVRRIRSLMSRPDLTKLDMPIFQDIMALSQTAQRARATDDRQLQSLGFKAPSAPNSTPYAQAAAQLARPTPAITLHDGENRMFLSRITASFTHSTPPPNESNYDRRVRAATDALSLISKAVLFLTNDPSVLRPILLAQDQNATLPSFSLSTKVDLAATFVAKMSQSTADISFLKHYFGRKFNVATASTRRRQTAQLTMGYDGTAAGHAAIVEAFNQASEELEDLKPRTRSSVLQRHPQAFHVGYLFRLDPDANTSEIVEVLVSHSIEILREAGVTDVDVEVAVEAEVAFVNRQESKKFWEEVKEQSGTDKSTLIGERKVQAIYSNGLAKHAVATAATKVFRPKSSAPILQNCKVIFASSIGGALPQYNVDSTIERLFHQQRYLNRTQYQHSTELPTIRPSRLFSPAGAAGLSIFSFIMAMTVPEDPTDPAAPRVSPYLNVYVSATSGALVVRAKPQFKAQAAAAAGIIHLMLAQQLEAVGSAVDLRYLLTVDGLISNRQMRLDPVTMRVTMLDEDGQETGLGEEGEDEDLAAIDRLLQDEERDNASATHSPSTSNLRRVRFSGSEHDGMSINTEVTRETQPDFSARRGAEVSDVLARLNRMGRVHEREAQAAAETNSVLSEISVRTHEMRLEITAAARTMVQANDHKPATRVLSRFVAEVQEAGLRGADVRPFLDSESLQDIAERVVDGRPRDDDLKALKQYNVAVAAACIDALEERGKTPSQEGTVINIDGNADENSIVSAVSTDSALNLLRNTSKRTPSPSKAPVRRSDESEMRREWAALSELVRLRSTGMPSNDQLQEELDALTLTHLWDAEPEAVRKHKILLESDFIRLDFSPPAPMQGGGWLERSTVTPSSEAGSGTQRTDGGMPSTN